MNFASLNSIGCWHDARLWLYDEISYMKIIYFILFIRNIIFSLILMQRNFFFMIRLAICRRKSRETLIKHSRWPYFLLRKNLWPPQPFTCLQWRSSILKIQINIVKNSRASNVKPNFSLSIIQKNLYINSDVNRSSVRTRSIIDTDFHSIFLTVNTLKSFNQCKLVPCFSHPDWMRTLHWHEHLICTWHPLSVISFWRNSIRGARVGWSKCVSVRLISAQKTREKIELAFQYDISTSFFWWSGIHNMKSQWGYEKEWTRRMESLIIKFSGRLTKYYYSFIIRL